MLILVKKLALVIVPASSASNTRFVLTVKAGTSFTAVTVATKLLVVETEPSLATTLMVALPLALVLSV